MKKLFLMLAFTGMVGAASATTVASMTKANVTIGGEEKKDEKKKKKSAKACCSKDAAKAGEAKACHGEKAAEAKSCSKDGAPKSCCKAKGTTATAAAETDKK
jgi:hypothetical protein